MASDLTDVEPLLGDVEIRHTNGVGNGGGPTNGSANGSGAAPGSAPRSAPGSAPRSTSGPAVARAPGAPAHGAVRELDLGTGLARQPFGAYLGMVDFCRVVVCFGVVFQHSFLWTGMSNNDIGTGFITMLHFTRDAFFILSGVVVCYAEITRPRSTWGFWKRRYVQLGVPYLAWTCIYVVYTILDTHVGWGQFGNLFWFDLRYGFYQLYVVIVLLQFYAVFPLLLWLLRKTSGRAHVIIVTISLAAAMFLGVVIHYHPDLGTFGHALNRIGHGLPWGRNLLSYQMYFIVGMVVAYHLDQVLAFVRKWHRWIVAASVAVGLSTFFYYVVDVNTGVSTGSASDIYTPVAVLWGFAATAGVFTLGWMWLQRGGQAEELAAGHKELPTGWRRRTTFVGLAELTGGIFLSHVLFINLIRLALYTPFIGGTDLAWPLKVLVFYVGTLSLAILFVSIIVRTPLRWVLGGPVRAEQRQEIEAFTERVEEAELASVSMAAGSTAAGSMAPAVPAP
jgi:peptidoglycan/LPS O-acetylase OafA/YrhL